MPAPSNIPRSRLKELPTHTFPLASRAQRELADQIDLGLCVLVAVGLGCLGLIVPSEFMVWVIVGGVLTALFTYWLTRAVMESSPLQAGPGMLILGIRVQNRDGSRLSFRRASSRFWLGCLFRFRIFMLWYLQSGPDPEDAILGCIIVKHRGVATHQGQTASHRPDGDQRPPSA